MADASGAARQEVSMSGRIWLAKTSNFLQGCGPLSYEKQISVKRSVVYDPQSPNWRICIICNYNYALLGLTFRPKLTKLEDVAAGMFEDELIYELLNLLKDHRICPHGINKYVIVMTVISQNTNSIQQLPRLLWVMCARTHKHASCTKSWKTGILLVHVRRINLELTAQEIRAPCFN